MFKVSGLATLQSFLNKSSKLKPKTEVHVGFVQTYALRVHEDMQMNHPNGGNAKFLENPAKRLDATIADTIAKHISTQSPITTIEGGMLHAGRMLLAEAQAEVPVDTSALKESGYVAEKSVAPSVVQAAFARSEALRLAVLAARKKKNP